MFTKTPIPHKMQWLNIVAYTLIPNSHVKKKNRPDSTRGKTFASGAGGMGLKSRANQISHTLPTTRHRCNLDCVGLGAKPRRWAPLTLDTQKGIQRV